MRPLGFLGVLLIIVGCVFLYRGGTFSTQREVLRVGDVKVTASERRSIPAWASGLTVAAGLVLVVAGLRRKR